METLLMSFAIKDLAGLSKPMTRLIDVVSQGVGAVAKPYLIRKNADADAYKIKTIATAIHEIGKQQKLPVIYDDKQTEIWQKPEDNTLLLDQKSIDDRISLRVDFQERKRQHNLENIISIAAIEMTNDESISDEKPDEDWILRFFSSAQDISSDQMQELWGRILAGETKSPGTFSLRTLDYIRNISKNDAELIEKVGRFALQRHKDFLLAVHTEKWLETQRGIYGEHLILLSELGVLYPNRLELNLFSNELQNEEFFINGKTKIIIKITSDKKKIVLPAWKFTLIGKELLNLISCKADDEYYDQVGLFFSNKGYKTMVTEKKGM